MESLSDRATSAVAGKREMNQEKDKLEPKENTQPMKQIDLFSEVRHESKAKLAHAKVKAKADVTNAPATDLMKKVAEKVPQTRKIINEFSPEDAAEIFDKIEKPSQKGEKEAELERSQRELIYNIKQTAKRMELGNKDKIIIFPSYSRKNANLTWYKLGDFSAEYYLYRMADRMGRSSSPRKDTDNFGRMHVIVSIRDVDKFVEEAMKLNEFSRHEETLDKIHILYLRKPLTDDEAALLHKTDAMRREMMHNVLRPKKAAPEMYLTILTLSRQITKMTIGLDRIYRAEIGDRMAAESVELMDAYFFFVGKLMDAETTRNTMWRLAYQLRAGTTILGESEVLKPEKACAIGETIVRLDGLIEKIK